MAYLPSDDCPHTPSDEANWQESDCTWFADIHAGVMGFFRLGQHPHLSEGAELLFVAHADGTQFRNVRDVQGALRDDNGQQIGNSVARSLGEQKMRYSWDEPDCTASLTFVESFYEPRGWAKDESAAALNQTINSQGHLECSGRMVGQINLGAVSIDVNALAHRDRSWGVRDISRVMQHRMSTGSFGPTLSWASTNLQVPTGDIMSLGFVVRDGVEEQAKRVEIVTHIAADGVSVAGGLTRLTLASGEVIEIECETKASFGHTYRNTHYFTTENMSIAKCQGMTGFCDLETAINPQRGIYVPAQSEVIAILLENGLHKAKSW